MTSRRLLAILCCSLAIGGNQPASAMTFTELAPVNGQKVLLGNGDIEAGDDERLRSLLRDRRFDDGLFVLNSEGGSILAGLEIGRAIWRARMSTIVAPKGECLSACFLTFLGGRTRTLPETSKIGSHQFYASDPGPGASAMANSQIYVSQILTYVLQTGVDVQALTPVFETPPDAMHIFSQDTARHYKIVTGVPTPRQSNGGTVIAPSGVPRPGCPFPSDLLNDDPLNLYPECR